MNTLTSEGRPVNNAKLLTSIRRLRQWFNERVGDGSCGFEIAASPSAFGPTPDFPHHQEPDRRCRSQRSFAAALFPPRGKPRGPGIHRGYTLLAGMLHEEHLRIR